MTDKNRARDLMELAERCEAATGDSFDLNHEIALALGVASEPFTASLDAAMQLVPKSDETRAVFWRLGNDGEGGNPGDFKAEVLVASTYTAKTFSGLTDTAPLALCAAALRALAQTEVPNAR